MKWVLLVGAALNYVGGLNLAASMVVTFPTSFPLVQGVGALRPPDYALHRLFTAGTAFCFGSMYVYLYLHPEYAVPFLPFGMALKYWAFAASLIAYRRFQLPRSIFVNFGCTNLVVGILFSAYLLTL
ncbi:MAG TPA: hypothetical protein VMK42_11860 [Anaeromyxobacteraceae bacterium]|nr:hypothetical protein [Anaeromyxobacteraceae bacterium]